MMRSKPAVLSLMLVVVLSLGAPSAFAQDKIGKVRELLELSQTESLFQQVLPTLLQQSQTQVKMLRPDIPDEVWALVFEEGEAAFRASVGAFIEQLVPVYDRIFTEAEIDGMLAFYASEVGQSVVKKLPQVTVEAAMLGQRWGFAVGEEIHKRMLSKLRDEGYRI